MSIEGQLEITLNHHDNNVPQVSIHSSRPFNLVDIFIGKTPEQLLTLLPLLFNICGNAQGYTAHQACQQALGIESCVAEHKARQLLVELETLREHCWRVLLDWPAFLNQEPQKQTLAAFLKISQDIKASLFKQGAAFKLDSVLQINESALSTQLTQLQKLVDETIFQERLQSWLAIENEPQLLDWIRHNPSLPARMLDKLHENHWQNVGRNHIALLPELETTALNHYIESHDGPALRQFPVWQGQCFESSVLNRQQKQPLLAELISRWGNGLLSRIIARLMEIAQTADRLKNALAHFKETASQKNPSLPEGIGLAQVQAARGLLIHRLQMQQGVIKDYQIIAPTEWNFHPQGVVAKSLQTLSINNEALLRQQAELIINAIDPCVKYVLKLTR